METGLNVIVFLSKKHVLTLNIDFSLPHTKYHYYSLLLFEIYMFFLVISIVTFEKSNGYCRNVRVCAYIYFLRYGYYKFNHAARYAKFIPRVYLSIKNQEQFPQCSYIIPNKKAKKNMSMHKKFINLPVLYIACIENSYLLHKSIKQASPKNMHLSCPIRKQHWLLSCPIDRKAVLLIPWY